MSDELFDQQPESQPDPLADPAPGPEDDPFAEVHPDTPAGPGDDELPPGVEPGTLGGVNPTEEAERLQAEAEAAALAGDAEEESEAELEEPLDDPPPPFDPQEDAREDVEAEAAAGDFGLEEQDREQAVAEDPPEEPTGQDLSTPLTTGVEDSRTQVAPSENGPESQTENAPDPLADPVDPPVEDPPAGEPESNGAVAKEEPKGEKKAAPKRRRRGKKEVKPGQRLYTILRLDTARAEDEAESLWIEEFEVAARSTELALRQAYRRLSDNSEGDFVLIATPSKYFKPTPVKGKVPEAALTIKVG